MRALSVLAAVPWEMSDTASPLCRFRCNTFYLKLSVKKIGGRYGKSWGWVGGEIGNVNECSHADVFLGERETGELPLLYSCLKM